MPRHLIQSPRWGQLWVEVLENSGEQVRPWRATLIDGPERLRHLVATVGVDERAAMAVMTEAVERYDSQPLIRRWPMVR